MTFNIIITGGRDYQDDAHLTAILDSIRTIIPNLFIVEGGATGADRLALVWRINNGVDGKTYPANWNQYGRAAGGIRNQQMLDEANPHMVLAFPGGIGTADMVRRAHAAKIPTYIVR